MTDFSKAEIKKERTFSQVVDLINRGNSSFDPDIKQNAENKTPGMAHNFASISTIQPKANQPSCGYTFPEQSYCPYGGACHTCPEAIQTKLKIGKSDDKYEREADRIAESLVNIPENVIQRSSCPTCDEEDDTERMIRRKPILHPISPLIQPQIDYEEKETDFIKEDKEIIMKGVSPRPRMTATDSISREINNTRGQGSGLPEGIRHYMEDSFGTSFSDVKVHTDYRSAGLNNRLNSKAFTIGQDIYFNKGYYSPNELKGKKLLAHELTHVVHQGEAQRLPQSFLSGRNTEQQPRVHYIDSGDLIQRKCIADHEVCTGGAKKTPSPASKPTSMPTVEATGSISGSPGGYSIEVGKKERKAREEAKKKPPEEKKKEKAIHGRQAVNLERLGKEAGLEMDLVHGVFVDLYMASGGKLATCSSYLPTKLGKPYKGDTKKKCIIVTDTLEKQAEYFYKNPEADRIPVFKKGSSVTWPRGEWRSRVALGLLEHELQHHRYNTATTHPDEPGGACTRSTVVVKNPDTGAEYNVSWQLSELSAILSEFPLVYRYATPVNRGLDSAPSALRNAIVGYVESEGESICGALTTLRCSCDCSEVDTYVRDTFKFTSAKWKEMERIYLNDILSQWRKGACKGAKPKKKRTDLDWPIKPSSKQLAELQHHLDVRAFGVPPRWEKRPFTYGLGVGGLGKSAGLAITAGSEWGFSSDQVAKIAWMGGPHLTAIVGPDSGVFLAGVRFGFEYRNDIRRGGLIAGGFGEAGAAFEKPISGPETSGLWDMYLKAGGYAGYRFKPGISASAEAFGGSTLGLEDASKRKLWGVGVRIGIELPSFSGSK